MLTLTLLVCKNSKSDWRIHDNIKITGTLASGSPLSVTKTLHTINYNYNYSQKNVMY